MTPGTRTAWASFAPGSTRTRPWRPPGRDTLGITIVRLAALYYTDRMRPLDCEEALADARLVPVMEAGIVDAKRLLERCLELDIPARLGGATHCGSGGCTPKAQVLVREEDAPRALALLEGDWIEAMEREGTLDRELIGKLRAAQANPEAEPPCPACGTSAPLVDGACSDCGLQLEPPGESGQAQACRR